MCRPWPGSLGHDVEPSGQGHVGICLPTPTVSWVLQPGCPQAESPEPAGCCRHAQAVAAGGMWQGHTQALIVKPLDLGTAVVAPLRLCGVHLYLSACSNPAGLEEGGRKPGIPEGQLGGC